MKHVWTLALLIAAMHVKAIGGDAPPIDPTRKDAWQKSLDDSTFQFNKNDQGVLHSLQQFRGDCKIEMIYDPANWSVWTFKLIHTEKEIATMNGDADSVFLGTRHVFYFAQFSNSSCGCKVLAFNTTTGEKIWERQLSAAGEIDHSKYSNHVTMRSAPILPGDSGEKRSDAEAKDKGSLVITGTEGAGDYVEVLDTETGEVLAHKVYRNK